jgi:hypothetical protein
VTALKRSKDRKVTSKANKAGTQAVIANAFGLPAGISCPGKTSVCGNICYALKLEKIYSGVRGVLMHNWDLLSNTSLVKQTHLISDMIDEFRAESVKRDAPLVFRIHWDGDFFSESYAVAWATVIKANADIQFWAYTRSFVPALNVIPFLANIDNLSLYLSVDTDNEKYVRVIREEYPAVRIAYLSDTFGEGKEVMLTLTDKPGAKCPELTGALPLITEKGGACVSCGLCVDGRADIRFAIKKR